MSCCIACAFCSPSRFFRWLGSERSIVAPLPAPIPMDMGKGAALPPSATLASLTPRRFFAVTTTSPWSYGSTGDPFTEYDLTTSPRRAVRVMGGFPNLYAAGVFKLNPPFPVATCCEPANPARKRFFPPLEPNMPPASICFLIRSTKSHPYVELNSSTDNFFTSLVNLHSPCTEKSFCVRKSSSRASSSASSSFFRSFRSRSQ
mmetsp:Transcript_41938/g.89325  ORF Transcript_41938/g.89325 Transcript_41938/m.89325 type:complete len:203 (+) Transcript_41938:45-653(+)